MPLTRRQRMRRAALICCHFLRNLAFYRAGWQHGHLRKNSQFWRNANGNFIDICVLEWCKIFADERGAHFWRTIIAEPDQFFPGLLEFTKQDSDQFNCYVNEMKLYRDKFIAHLDSELVMHIPKMRIGCKCISYFYNYVLAHENDGNDFPDAPPSAYHYYKMFAHQGRTEYLK